MFRGKLRSCSVFKNYQNVDRYAFWLNKLLVLQLTHMHVSQVGDFLSNTVLEV